MTPEAENEDRDLSVGGFVKSPKGDWQLDGVKLKTGPDGVRMTVLMTTARHGQVHFDKSGETVKPVIAGLKRYQDCDPSRESLPEGRDPYTIFQCLIDGELCTYAASSWAARKSFKKLVDNWRFLHPREFPVVILGTRPSGDANDNIAPTFKPIAWVPVSDFAGMLAPTAPALPAPVAADEFVCGTQTVTSGRPEIAPPIDAYDGPDEDDVIR
jgi:hypothetical protein